MLSPKQLQSLRIDSLENGREHIADIDRRSKDLFLAMSKEGSIPKWQKLQDQRYELLKAKRNIQGQMGKIVANARSNDESLAQVAILRDRVDKFFGKLK